ncbi:sigma-70 family RNA polymerase sigma factor [Paraflavitalea sp. CAU 1676]|uniref:RNA polymerase sigma factor n=1 Tax=Paraflavitalea sp. CAU 1676 TaxID=3032598 RepID=UPI0023DC1CE9|nr:sigma-70 family RNA polymerase sigma factor [Paraflavitalea sp. CAU 1676]MDF2192440.1 sigma-70 family RNA polymerase sigma factor [Paraflavitalea sp. CAU 1676]
MTSSTDIALWDQLRTGDEKALYALYQLSYDELLQYGMRLCNHAEESKDAINIVFASLWSHRAKLPITRHPRAYLFACYKNRLLRQMQKVQKLVPIEAGNEELLLSTASVEEALIELQEYEATKARTARLLSQLTDRQQELLRLRFLEELSYEAIAQQLNISVRTVYNSIHESIKTLRGMFDQ